MLFFLVGGMLSLFSLSSVRHLVRLKVKANPLPLSFIFSSTNQAWFIFL